MTIWSLTGLVSRRLAMAGVCAIALVACGGGGGGGGPSSISYTGSTTQATIDGSNATALAGSAFASGDAGASANVLGVASGSASQPVEQRSIKIASVLQSAVGKINLQPSASTAAGAVQTESSSVAGSCGGSLSYTISVDDVTGDFSGSLNFNGYCEQVGNSISGHVSFSGHIDLNTSVFTSLQFNATYLALVDNGSNFAFTGTVAFVFSGSSATVTENFDIQDGSGNVYRVQNLVIGLTNTGSEVQETFNGRFYHPDHGYVDVVTNTTFVIPIGSAYPTSGSLTITGALGTKAVLTALSDGTYTLDVDTDGNGTLETHLTGNWVDL
jgi:hypothetical protein